MKPKTKLQMEIVNGSRKLAPVSEAQKRYAYKHCFVHHFQLFGDDVEARPLNVGGQMMLRRQYSIPFRAFIPFW